MRFRLATLSVSVLFLVLCGCGDGDNGTVTEICPLDDSPLGWAEASSLNNEAIVLMDQDEVGKAILIFKELAERTSGLFVPRFNLAIGWLNAQNVDREAREAEMVESESLLREVMKEFPDRVEAPYSLAVLLEHMGRDQVEIERLYQRALELAPSHPECLYRMGKFYFQKRPPELEKAEALLQRALELEGHFASAWNTLFATYHRLKKKDQAKAAMDAFSFYSDSLPEQGKKLSLVYNFMGEYGCCIRQLDMQPASGNEVKPELSFAPQESRLAIPKSNPKGFSSSPTAADLDQDGNLEIFHHGKLYTWDGKTFRDSTATWGLGDLTGSKGGVFADLDHDQDLDLIAFGSFGIKTLLNQGKTLIETKLLPLSSKPIDSVQVADLDHDGDIDVVTSDSVYSNLRPTIYEAENVTRPAFKTIPWTEIDPEGSSYEHIVLVDVDRDGDLDVIRSSSTVPAVLLLNDRLWRFHRIKEIPLGGVRGPIAMADINQDGLPDILASGDAPKGFEAKTLLNGFPAAFKQMSWSSDFTSASRLVAADVDNDGRPDLLSVGENRKVAV
ncbi:MAG: tetratricopeptide (TPR) repeat protein, partial [Planctomycetota bacterium]